MDKLNQSKIINSEYFVDDSMWRIDLRRLPKKVTSENIQATIIQAINDLFHVDYKMLGISSSHFNEYLDMLVEMEFIRLAKGEDPSRVESYIIGKIIPNDILNNRPKLLKYIYKKFDLVLKTATETATIKMLGNH